MLPALIGNAAVQINVMVNANLASGLTDAAGHPLNGPVSWLDTRSDSCSFRWDCSERPWPAPRCRPFRAARRSGAWTSFAPPYRVRCGWRCCSLSRLRWVGSAGESMIGAVYQGAVSERMTRIRRRWRWRATARPGGYAAIKLLAPAFYALDDAWTPMAVSLASIGLNLPLAVGLARGMRMGRRGWRWPRRWSRWRARPRWPPRAPAHRRIEGRRLAVSAAKTTLAAVAMGGRAVSRAWRFTPQCTAVACRTWRIWAFRFRSASASSMCWRGCSAFRNFGRSKPHVTLRLAMLADLKLAIRLQEIDTHLVGLQREIAALPVHISAIEKKLYRTSASSKPTAPLWWPTRRNASRARAISRCGNRRFRSSKGRWSRPDQRAVPRLSERDRFLSGGDSQLEDRILDLMGESEPLDKNVKAAEAALRTEKVQVETEKERARERTAADRKAAAELQQERAAIVSQMSATTVQRYERARKARRGIALAEVVEGRCNVCQMALRLQYFQDLKKDDQILSAKAASGCCTTIPGCGRDLTGEPPRGAGPVAPAVLAAGRHSRTNTGGKTAGRYLTYCEPKV